MNNLQTNIEKASAGFNIISTGDAERRTYKDFQKDWKAYLEQHEKVLFLSRTNRKREARELLQGRSNELYDRVVLELVGLADLNKQGVENDGYTAVGIIVESRKIILAGLFIAVVCVVATTLSVMRSITRSMLVTIEALYRISRGDFTENLQVSSRDEMCHIISLIQNIQESLGRIIKDITTSVQEVSSRSEQVALDNANLSKRTNEHGANLEELASSMKELLNTVNQNADNAQQANQLALASREKADRGGAVVHKAVAAMDEITVSSNRIADIISVIDEIAFQTNLLALNAAVEAARAGEQGRGFAVVAAEVRTLAVKSAEAAKEIKDLIQDSVARVEEGSKLVNDSGKVLEDIVVSVKKVYEIVAEIAAASQEQSLGIAHVNKAIMQMDEVTQQNSALVEEAAAVSQAVSAQAQQLNALVEYFKLKQGNKQILAVNDFAYFQNMHGNEPRQVTMNGTGGNGSRFKMWRLSMKKYSKPYMPSINLQ